MANQHSKNVRPQKKLKNGNILELIEVPVQGLDMKDYIEFRVEERNPLGEFLGYSFFTSVQSHAISYLEKA